jgi:prepilin-type N-terminal cleavage/methylation domain-containing protein
VNQRARPGSAPCKGAFTLIELLVALLVASVVIIGSWLFWSGGSRQVVTGQRKLDSLRSAHLVFELLHRDLKSARSVLVTSPSAPATPPVTTFFFIDGKEYAFDPAQRRLSIGGEPFRLTPFEEVTASLQPEGLVQVRIVSLADPADVPDGYPGKKAGRMVLEMDAVVEVIRDQAHYPYVLGEEREAHGYCSMGDPIDY